MLVVSADHQSLTLAEPVARWTSASPTTTAFSARYTTAMPMASLNPRRNTAASAASSRSVTGNWCPSGGRNDNSKKRQALSGAALGER